MGSAYSATTGDKRHNVCESLQHLRMGCPSRSCANSLTRDRQVQADDSVLVEAHVGQFEHLRKDRAECYVKERTGPLGILAVKVLLLVDLYRE